MIFGNPYWSIKTKLDLLARWLIVHSIIYYNTSAESIVTDLMWDANAKQYTELASVHQKEFMATRWYYVMADFDGNTGFDLFSRLKPEDQHLLMESALSIIKPKFKGRQ